MALISGRKNTDEKISQNEMIYFVWRTQPKACNVCAGYNGMIFHDIDEIPEPLHPNCLCFVEVYNCIPTEGRNEEEIEKEKLKGDSSSLEEEVIVKLDNINNDLENSTLKGQVVIEEYLNDLKDLEAQVSDTRKILETYPEFSKEEFQTVQQIINEQQEYYKQLEKAYDKELRNLENPKDNPFIDDIEKHEVMFDLIKHTYDKGGEELLHGYEEVTRVHDEETAMDVTIYNDDKEVVILFPGSDKGDYGGTDKDLFISKENNQYEKAKEVYEAVKNSPQFENHKIIITGYSLGGNTATMIGAEGNHDTVVFAPYGSEKDTIQKRVNETQEAIKIHPEKVVVYQQEKDYISAIGDKGHIGIFIGFLMRKMDYYIHLTIWIIFLI